MTKTTQMWFSLGQMQFCYQRPDFLPGFKLLQFLRSQGLERSKALPPRSHQRSRASASKLTPTQEPSPGGQQLPLRTEILGSWGEGIYESRHTLLHPDGLMRLKGDGMDRATATLWLWGCLTRRLIPAPLPRPPQGPLSVAVMSPPPPLIPKRRGGGGALIHPKQKQHKGCTCFHGDAID